MSARVTSVTRWLPSLGMNEPLQHPLVALGGAGLETEIDVLLLEPLGELLDGDGTPIGIAPGRWIIAVLGGRDDRDRPATRLLAGKYAAWSEADASRPSRRRGTV